MWDFSALGGLTSSISRRVVKLTVSHYYSAPLLLQKRGYGDDIRKPVMFMIPSTGGGSGIGGCSMHNGCDFWNKKQEVNLKPFFSNWANISALPLWNLSFYRYKEAFGRGRKSPRLGRVSTLKAGFCTGIISVWLIFQNRYYRIIKYDIGTTLINLYTWYMYTSNCSKVNWLTSFTADVLAPLASRAVTALCLPSAAA